MKQFLSVNEVAELLSVNPMTITSGVRAVNCHITQLAAQLNGSTMNK